MIRSMFAFGLDVCWLNKRLKEAGEGENKGSRSRGQMTLEESQRGWLGLENRFGMTASPKKDDPALFLLARRTIHSLVDIPSRHVHPSFTIAFGASLPYGLGNFVVNIHLPGRYQRFRKESGLKRLRSGHQAAVCGTCTGKRDSSAKCSAPSFSLSCPRRLDGDFGGAGDSELEALTKCVAAS